MKMLLGLVAKVVQATNKSLIGITGYICYESQERKNHSIVLFSQGKFKRIDKCLIKVDEKYLWISSREIGLIKKIKLKVSGI